MTNATNKFRLIASSGSESEIVKMANKFFYTDSLVNDNGTIRNSKTGKVLDHHRITQKGKRWRLEQTIGGLA